MSYDKIVQDLIDAGWSEDDARTVARDHCATGVVQSHLEKHGSFHVNVPKGDHVSNAILMKHLFTPYDLGKRGAA